MVRKSRRKKRINSLGCSVFVICDAEALCSPRKMKLGVVSPMEVNLGAHLHPPSSTSPSSFTTPRMPAPARALSNTTSLYASTASMMLSRSRGSERGRWRAGKILQAAWCPEECVASRTWASRASVCSSECRTSVTGRVHLCSCGQEIPLIDDSPYAPRPNVFPKAHPPTPLSRVRGVP